MKTELRAVIAALKAEKQRIEVAISAISAVLVEDIMDAAPPKAERVWHAAKRQRIAPELKQRIVQEYLTGNDTLQAVAHRHGVSHSAAANWVYGRKLGKPNGSMATADSAELVNA